MIVSSIRKHSSVKLEWIAKELYMGVRNGVTQAEQRLKILLKNKKAVQKTWRRMEKMHYFSAWSPICHFSDPICHTSVLDLRGWCKPAMRVFYAWSLLLTPSVIDEAA